MAESVLESVLGGIREVDEDIFEYLKGIVGDTETHGCDPELLTESVGPFLLSSGWLDTEEEADAKCKELAMQLQEALGMSSGAAPAGDEEYQPKLLDNVVKIKDQEASNQAELDYMWGTDKVREKYNQHHEGFEKISKKDKRKMEQELDRQLKELENLNGTSNDDAGEVHMMVLPDYSSGNNEKDINVQNFGLHCGSLELLEGADLKLAFGRKYGIVGKNGIGKTTLLRHIAAYDIEGFPRHHRVLHVQQEIRASDKSVLQVVLDSDVERTMLMKEEKDILERQQQPEAETPPVGGGEGGDGGGEGDGAAAGAATAATSNSSAVEDSKRLGEIYERLGCIDAHTAEARAATILTGLGFSVDMQNGRTDALSGGWRMRVAIAGALFIQPDLLMLDEPTNHLDLEAVLWLQDYLTNYPKTLMLVSHDRAFLNEVSTDIVLFFDRKLLYYRGDFSSYEAVRGEQLKQQRRAYEAQLAKKEHMQEFITKFRYNAKRASLVQSRIKAMEKLEELENVDDEKPFEFSLADPGAMGRPLLQIEGVTFGFDENRPLFTDVHFGVDMDSRIGIVGPNGAGKSTLLNLIVDKLRPIDGQVLRHTGLKIATFTQHHAEQFDYRYDAVTNLIKLFPGTGEQEARSFLGRFNIGGDLAVRPLKFLSGGQKSRVAFAALAYKKPHVCILDEPTNHLDMETIDALIGALKEFGGAVLVVSHDQHFISQVCNEIWVVGGGKVAAWKGDFDDYKRAALLSVGKKLKGLENEQGGSKR